MTVFHPPTQETTALAVEECVTPDGDLPAHPYLGSADFAAGRMTRRSLGICAPNRFSTHWRSRVWLLGTTGLPVGLHYYSTSFTITSSFYFEENVLLTPPLFSAKNLQKKLDKVIGRNIMRNVISYYGTSKCHPNETQDRTILFKQLKGFLPSSISLGKVHTVLPIRELSSRIKLPKGTTHRLLSSLSYFGYVRQDSRTRNYFLGFKLVELGHLLLSQLDLRKEAEPFLRDLAERTKGDGSHGLP